MTTGEAASTSHPEEDSKTVVLQNLPENYGVQLVTDYIEGNLDIGVKLVTIHPSIRGRALVVLEQEIEGEEKLDMDDFPEAAKVIQESPLEGQEVRLLQTRREKAVVITNNNFELVSEETLRLYIESEFADGYEVIESTQSWSHLNMAVLHFLPQSGQKVIDDVLENSDHLILPSEDYHISIGPFYRNYHEFIGQRSGAVFKDKLSVPTRAEEGNNEKQQHNDNDNNDEEDELEEEESEDEEEEDEREEVERQRQKGFGEKDKYVYEEEENKHYERHTRKVENRREESQSKKGVHEKVDIKGSKNDDGDKNEDKEEEVIDLKQDEGEEEVRERVNRRKERQKEEETEGNEIRGVAIGIGGIENYNDDDEGNYELYQQTKERPNNLLMILLLMILLFYMLLRVMINDDEDAVTAFVAAVAVSVSFVLFMVVLNPASAAAVHDVTGHEENDKIEVGGYDKQLLQQHRKRRGNRVLLSLLIVLLVLLLLLATIGDGEEVGVAVTAAVAMVVPVVIWGRRRVLATGCNGEEDGEEKETGDEETSKAEEEEEEDKEEEEEKQ